MNDPEKPAGDAESAATNPTPVEAPYDDFLILQVFRAGAKVDRVLVDDLIVRAVREPALYLPQFKAFRQRLQDANRLDEQADKFTSEVIRQLEKALGRSSQTGAVVEFDVPVQFRRGALSKNQTASIDSAVDMIAAVAGELGIDDLSGTRVLDIGCGVKFTQAFYGRKIPVKRYHGVDVDPGMIEYLSSNVKDDRFSYKYIDVYNERYHRTGEPLSAETNIGAAGETFDLVCLFSVFTHLAPADYQAMLALIRKYIAPAGILFFTTFIDERIEGSFADSDPAQPLWMALYKESAVREFAAATGWSIRRIFLKRMQHWVVCAPSDHSI